MAETGKQVKVSLKIWVDVKANKVLFAEAGSQFVNFIFQIMSLPLSTVTKILNNGDAMVGCLGYLYKSIESLSTQYFVPNINKDSVLQPRASVVAPLLSLCERPTMTKIYKCTTHNIISDVQGTACPSCGNGMPEFCSRYAAPRNVNPTYVKDAVVYMVMDNLEVKPMSLSLIKSHVKDLDHVLELEESVVDFGVQEGLALLRACFETDAVLSAVLLGEKMKFPTDPLVLRKAYNLL